MLKNTSPHNYALFMAARDLCDKTEAVTMTDLAQKLRRYKLTKQSATLSGRTEPEKGGPANLRAAHPSF